MILALDVSSTRTGYALFEGRRRVEAGVIRPPSPISRDACLRAFGMASDVRGILEEHAGAIEVVVIEEAPRFKAKGDIAAQNRAFGMVMGVLLGRGARVVPIHPATWTRNSDKERRAADVIARHGLPVGSDKGHDAADAIGLAEWWETIGRHRTEGGTDDAKPVRGRRRSGR